MLLDEVIGIDTAARRVETRFGDDQSYDYLVLATGSQYAYFGHDDWPRLAPGLKSIDDATLIRRRLLLAFEEAESVSRPGDPPAPFDLCPGRRRADRGRDGRSARRARPCHPVARLPPHQPAHGAYPAGRGRAPGAGRLSREARRFARRSLEGMGVEVLLDTPIEAIDALGVMAGASASKRRM